ncbi:MAG: SDR family NAD(P)-dependent oxidoreductase, partial [Thiohalocapsa sp.]
EARLLQRCGPHLRAVLEGHAEPLDLLFGDGGDLAAAVYRDSPCAAAVNRIAAAAFSELVGGRRNCRVIEIGCGTGGTTAALRSRLRPGDTYLATDLSPGFAAALQRRLGVAAGTLDITRPLAAQGFAPGSFDIAIAANVLHATPSVREALAHAAALVGEDGALLLVENAGPLLWGDLTFGLTEGMWQFADAELRPDHALLPPDRWAGLLDEAGFEARAYAPGGDETAALSGQFVVVARRRRTGHDRVWVAPPTAVEAAPALLEAALGEVKGAIAAEEPVRLRIVTQRARAVLPGETPDPVQAMLWGMANSVALEHPELSLAMIDVADPADLAAAAAIGVGETRLALRHGGRLAARLLPMAAPESQFRPRPDATYLVTGGLGGVGLAVARWLAEHGACSLALLGRTLRELPAFPPEVAVSAHRCDVADADAVAALLSLLGRERPPLAGIFHAAGVLDDGVLATQTRARIEAVLRPKVQGAAVLDRLTRGLPLDQFVLFSSSSAMLGSAAQANHAAANAFLDALAERRRAEGLPAVSIAWGAWGEIGAAARAGAGVARRGLLPMHPDDALAALAHAMTADQPAFGIFVIDWLRFLDRFAGAPLPPLFVEVAPAVVAAPAQPAAAGAGEPDRDWRGILAAAPPEARGRLLIDELRRLVAHILGLPPGEFPEPAAPLREVGLDSLMSIELRNALAAACETRLPATLVFEHPSCAALADHLMAAVFAELRPPMPAGEADGLDDLDAAALARLLEEELSAADAQLGDGNE